MKTMEIKKKDPEQNSIEKLPRQSTGEQLRAVHTYCSISYAS